jgi:hypothetical protein
MKNQLDSYVDVQYYSKLLFCNFFIFFHFYTVFYELYIIMLFQNFAPNYEVV